MADFNPQAIDGHFYTDGNITIKVIGFEGEGNQRAVYKDVDSNKNEIEPRKTITKSQWNRRNFEDLSQTGGTPPPISGFHGTTNGNSTLYTIEVNEEGRLVIRNQEGIEIIASNIKGPEGQHGEIGPQGPIGEGGHDGLTWTPRITQDGLYIYFENERGEKSTSYRFKGESGERGAQGPAGPAGQDADLWKPQTTPDGKQLFFVNQKGEQTEKYPIQGVKGDRGAEGPTGPIGPEGPVFIPSVNADGQISWSNNGNLPNPTPINIKGSQGQKGDNGAIFHPSVIDGYLIWTNDKGLPNPDPVKITGPQGETGETGKTGKSAYQIWLDHGFVGSEQDFLDSLKGKQGEAAEQITTGYEDVTDHHCKVQNIDVNLITDSSEISDEPEEIIEKRTEEIKSLRAEGHNPENKKKYHVGPFKKFAWRCAGADQDLLTMCPSDHSKYVGVGTVILFTALMAWFSSFIAMRLVFGVGNEGIWNIGSLGAAIFALFWASMIFFLDRFITNTMYSDGKVTISKEEFFSGLPRISIAVFLGIVISAPLELMIFKDKIEKEIKMQYIEEKNLKMNEAIISANDNFDRERNKLIESQQMIISERSRIENSRRDFIKNNRPEDKMGNSGDWINRETGEKMSGKTVNSNAAAQARWDNDKTNKQQLADYASQIKKMSQKSDSIQNLINTLDNNRKNFIQADTARILSIFSSQFDTGLSRQLSTLHSLAMKDYEPWFYYENPPTNRNDIASKNIRDSIQSASTIALDDKEEYLYGAENHKFAAAMDTILHSWWWFLFNSAQGLIMLLFILIDISPVLYKMMLADGNYDNYLHQEKLLAQDKIRLSLSKMLQKLDDSELKRVAPFIMGDIYEKMAGDSYVFKTEAEFKDEMSQFKEKNRIWKLWPLSWLRWLFWKEEDYPSAPVIVLDKKENSEQQDRINEVNNAVFEEVLDMKRRIILASYRQWYKRQHDNILGNRVDDENAGRLPFE